MSKIYGTLVLILVTFSSNAQIKKNATLLGGQLFYYSDKYKLDNSKTQQIESATIGVSIGKAFKENSVIGINFNYSPIKQSNFYTGFDTTTTKLKSFNIGAFYREYRRLAKDFYFFSEISGAAIIANQTTSYMQTSGDVKSTQRGGFISITPGVSYPLFKKVQLEVTIPNILSMQYLVTRINSDNQQVKNSKDEQILFYSNLANTTPLGFLGVGFRFIL